MELEKSISKKEKKERILYSYINIVLLKIQFVDIGNIV